MTKKGRAKVNPKDQCEPQLDDSCCPPDEPFRNENVEITKKKKKSKHPREDTVLDQDVTLKRDSENHEVAIPVEEEVTIKEKKKRSKHSRENTERDQEVTLKRVSENQEVLIPVEEEVVSKKKKKKKEHSSNVEDVISHEPTDLLLNEDVINRKKNKKNRKHGSQISSVLEEENPEVPESTNPQNGEQSKEEPNNNDEQGDTKKKKKRKRSNALDDQEKSSDPVESNLKTECNDESSDVKKKKVSWKEIISESKEPEVSKDNEKPTAECPPANSGFLTLLSNVDSIPDQEELAVSQHHPTWEKSAAKKRKRVERRLELRNAKREKRKQKKLETVLGENGSKAMKSLADCNISNRKLKEKIEELLGSIETMDVKRPRLDEGITSGPTRKRLKSITPDREIVPGHKWKDLTEQQKETFNRKREQRRLDKLTVPKVVLINQANYSSLRLEDEERSPLTLGDIQHFLIYCAHGHHSTGNIPSWVSLKHPSKISKIVCVVVDGASLSDYTKHEDQLPALKSFQFQLEVITPYAYGGDFSKEFWTVPLSRTQRARLIRRYGSLREANLKGEAFESLKKMYPVGAFLTKQTATVDDRKPTGSPEKKKSPSVSDQFPRTELLLRSWDLLRESVPVPFATGFLGKRYEGFVRTKDQYSEVTDDSPIWAVDCEMCETCQGSELTRISVINENFEVVYESLVKPYNPITNYLTQFSGITPADLQNEWTRLEDVQQDLRSLLPPDVILAGHSVGNDLMAMKMFHPYVIDTSVCFNLSGIRGRKTKLKTLMAELLYERIQEGGKSGHDSVEDAASCLKLIKTKLARSIEWGDAVLGGKRSEEESVIAQQQLILRSREEKVPSVYPVAAKSIIRSGPRAHQTVNQGEKTVQRPYQFQLKVLPSAEPSRPEDKPTDRTVFTKSLVSHLFADGVKNLLVVGSGEFLRFGKENIDTKTQKALRVDPRLQFTVQEDNKVLKYGCEHAPSNGLSILRLPASNLKGDTPLITVDTMIEQTVKNFTENVLFMVFLTGKGSDDESSALDNHGLFMMKIVKPAYVPLTFQDLSHSTS